MPSKRGVPIKLGDRTKERTIRFDMQAFERLQDETAGRGYPDGMPLVAINGEIAKLNSKVITTCLWVGLLHAEPQLTRQQVLSLIDSTRLTEIVEALGSALEKALPDFEKPKQAAAGEVEGAPAEDQETGNEANRLTA